MRALLLLASACALAPISTPPKRTEFREGIGGATKEQAVAVGETVECAKKPIGPRDVVIRCYDISSDGPPVFSFNLGECVYDDAGIDEVLRKMEADYNEEEYDFFFRNCNHFADDLGRRLSDGNEVDRKFMEDYVIFESESLLCNMASFQRSMTMAVTRQIQKIVIVSWRRSWKKALAEEAEASKVTT